MFFFSPMLFFSSGELPGVQWPSPGRGAGVTLRSFQRVFHSASKAAARRVHPASAGIGSEDARCLHGGHSLTTLTDSDAEHLGRCRFAGSVTSLGKFLIKRMLGSFADFLTGLFTCLLP